MFSDYFFFKTVTRVIHIYVLKYWTLSSTVYISINSFYTFRQDAFGKGCNLLHQCCARSTLHSRHDERDGVSNHGRLDYLLNRLFRCRSKKTSKLWPLCGESIGDQWIPLTKGQQCGKCFRLMASSWGIKGRDKYLHPTDTVGCNYLSMPLRPAFDTTLLIHWRLIWYVMGLVPTLVTIDRCWNFTRWIFELIIFEWNLSICDTDQSVDFIMGSNYTLKKMLPKHHPLPLLT